MRKRGGFTRWFRSKGFGADGTAGFFATGGDLLGRQRGWRRLKVGPLTKGRMAAGTMELTRLSLERAEYRKNRCQPES
jgi:hypothetical protein